MSEARYPQVMRLCAETPWAIRAEKLAVIRDMLAVRASGGRFTAEEIQARIGAGPAQRQGGQTGTVAVLPLYGVITPRADLMTEMSGGTSVEQFTRSFRAALANPDVGAILLDVDSPGGMTDLVPELAAEIRDARGVKPITAIANTDAASAAYWLAVQADEFVVTPSGMVGSIGVFAAHDDMSAALEREGVTTTLISAGRYKVEANPYEPLTDEAREAIQARVDSFYEMFVSDVAQGRDVTTGAVRAGFGEGRMVTASDALKMGMVDRVASFEETVEGLIFQAAGGRERMAGGFVSAYTGPSRLAIVEEPIPAPDPPPTEPTPQPDPEPAASGFSFAVEAAAARDAADRLAARARSLAEVRRGRMTAAKRDQLSAVAGSLRDSAAALAELVASTDKALHAPAAQREHLEYLRSISK